MKQIQNTIGIYFPVIKQNCKTNGDAKPNQRKNYWFFISSLKQIFIQI